MKKIVLPLIVLLVVTGVSAVIATKQMSEKKEGQVTNIANTEPETPANPQPGSGSSDLKPQTTPGRYESYSEEKTADSRYETTVLFFFAGWCPECRAFKQAITTSTIPSSTQVLEVNYDKASDLKQKYGVTLQSTFVKVDSKGNQRAKWVGYGKEKSLQTVLSNL